MVSGVVWAVLLLPPHSPMASGDSGGDASGGSSDSGTHWRRRYSPPPLFTSCLLDVLDDVWTAVDGRRGRRPMVEKAMEEELKLKIFVLFL